MGSICLSHLCAALSLVIQAREKTCVSSRYLEGRFFSGIESICVKNSHAKGISNMSDKPRFGLLYRMPSVSSTTTLISWASILLSACTFTSSGFVDVSEINLEAVPNRSAMRITDVAIGRGGVVYICDRTRSRVYRVSTNENKADVIRPNAIDNGNTWRPSAVAVGKEGMLYVAAENEVRIFDMAGRVVTRFKAEIAHPTSIAVMDDGTTYVAGFNNGYVLHRYNLDGEGGIIHVSDRASQDVRVNIAASWGGMVRTWERGVLFGTNMPFELVALGNDGNVIRRQLRPKLNLDLRLEFEESPNTAMVQIYSSGSGLSIATDDSLIYYCFSPKESGLFTDISRVYVDVYDRNFKSIAKDITIDGVILAADKDGYVYFTKKNHRGLDGLFRGKFKYRSIE